MLRFPFFAIEGIEWLWVGSVVLPGYTGSLLLFDGLD